MKIPGFRKAALLLAAAVVFTPGRAISASGPGIELDEVVVTAGRIEEPRERAGSSVTVITREEIEESGAFFLKDILAGVPGMSIATSGPPGQQSDIRTRGTHPGATLVMIDGMKVHDPILIRAEFDPAHLPVEGIERVEIIRGPQSTLYGSDAMGGVINIITRKGEGKPHLRTSLTGGSFGTWQPSLRYGGRAGDLSFSLGASLLESEGISIVEGGKPDHYRRETLDGQFSWSASDRLEFDLNLRHWKAGYGMDDWGADNPEFEGETRFSAARFGVSFFASDRWDHRFRAGHTETKRFYSHPLDGEDAYSGKISEADWQQTYRFNDSHLLVGGLSWQEELGESPGFERRKNDTRGIYLQHRAETGPLAATLGGRSDRHSELGSHLTWRATSSLELAEGTRLRASYGTGFKAPSLFQLYSESLVWGAWYRGNPDLDPEESRGWDAGISQRLGTPGRNLRLEASWFENRVRNKIANREVIPWAEYVLENIHRAESSGLELSAAGKIGPFTTRLAYTFLRAHDGQGERLNRKPRHTWHWQGHWRFHEKARAGLFVNRRENWLDFGNPMDSYTTCALVVEYRASETLSARLKVDNIFDEDYQQVLGYETPGRAFYLSLEQNW